MQLTCTRHEEHELSVLDDLDSTVNVALVHIPSWGRIHNIRDAVDGVAYHMSALGHH